MRSRAAIAVLALLVGATACTGSDDEGACSPTRILREGDALPDCTFELIGGGTMALSELQGQATVLNFWASWCLECLKEMPAFDRFDQAHPEVRVLGVNALIQGETAEAGASYFEERGVGYDSIVDPEGQLYAHFSARVLLPATVIVDANGVVAARHFGALSEQGLDEKVAEALA